MTDTDYTPPEEHNHSISFKRDFDEYGLNQQDDGTRIIRIDQDTHFFERIGLIECRSVGVVFKEHSRLTDEGSGEIADVYQPIQFVSPTDEFEERLRDAVFELIYDGKISEEVAEELSAELAGAMSGQYSDGSLHR